MAPRATARDGIAILPVTADRWPDFEALFAARGGPKACWCMVWRAQGEEAKHPDGKHRKAAMHARIMAGERVGLLAYRDGEPVGWCSVAPRTTYRDGLGGTPNDDPAASGVWSIACFFIPRAERGQGIFAALMKGAEAHARKHKGTMLEAYPVDPGSPSYRFMGFVPSFEAAGFTAVGRAGSRRHVMQKQLSRSR